MLELITRIDPCCYKDVDMLSFKRTFQTRQQALDVYRSQLSEQKLFVESFEGYPKGSPVVVKLEIRETEQQIELNGTVERLMGKREAVELGYGQRPGLVLDVPITQDLIAPLRAFFLAQSKSGNAPAPNATQGSGINKVNERPSARIPFENLASCPQEQAEQEVARFFELAERGNVYQLFNVRPDVDRKELRRIYNIAVRSLHPDSQSDAFSSEFAEKLDDAYQIFNEAYQLLQHPVKKAIYQEVSRMANCIGGMSLNSYKAWQEDYRLKNSVNINMADELVLKAKDAIANNASDEAKQCISLALHYDRFNEAAREMQLTGDEK